MTKAQVQGFLSPEEVSELKKAVNLNEKVFVSKVTNKVVKGVLSKFCELVGCEPKEESYAIAEIKKEGHKWHVDTGTNNHMPWCSWGASILLSGENSGGKLHYEDGSVDQNVGDLVYHSSDVRHMVTPNNGSRMVFLIFV